MEWMRLLRRDPAAMICAGREGRREDPWQPGKVSDDEGEMRGDSRGPALAFVSGADCRMQALEGLEGKSRMLLNDG